MSTAESDRTQFLLERVNHSLRSPLSTAMLVLNDQTAGRAISPDEWGEVGVALGLIRRQLDCVRDMAANIAIEDSALLVTDLLALLVWLGVGEIEAPWPPAEVRADSLNISNATVDRVVRLARLLFMDGKCVRSEKVTARILIRNEAGVELQLSDDRNRSKADEYEKLSLFDFGVKDHSLRGAVAIRIAEILERVQLSVRAELRDEELSSIVIEIPWNKSQSNRVFADDSASAVAAQ